MRLTKQLTKSTPFGALTAATVEAIDDNHHGGSQDMPRKPAVLFVCLGNICRSPLAEAAFSAEAVRIGDNQRRQISGCGARTAVTSLKAVLESSDVLRFVWILMEFRRRR
jgi:hypothetical protein